MSNMTLKAIVSDLRELIIKYVSEQVNQKPLEICLPKIPINTKEEHVTYVYTTSKNIVHSILLNEVFTQRGLSLAELTNDFLMFRSDESEFLFKDNGMLTKINAILARIDQSEYEKDDFLTWLHQYWLHTSTNELLSAEKVQDQSFADLMYYEVLSRLDQEQTLFGEYYTPFWAVKYIVDHSIDYYRHNCNCPVEQIKLLDPACGTGNFLIYALDALTKIYQEEHSDWSMLQIVTSILSHNLFGAEIQEDTLQIACWNLWLKAMKVTAADGHEVLTGDTAVEYRKLIQQNVISADSLCPWENAIGKQNFPQALSYDNLPRLSQFYQQKYDIVVMNPPFVDTRNMPEALKSFMRTYYPDNARNLVAAFIERMLQLTQESSVIGFIASDTFKTLVSFRNLRKCLLETTRIRSMIELGYGVFDADVSCGIYFLDKQLEDANAIKFLDARKVKKNLPAPQVLKQLEIVEHETYRILQSAFLTYQDYVFLTDVPHFMAELYAQKSCLGLGVHPIAECRVGLQIGNQEAKFTKHRWDIPQNLLEDKTYVRISKSNRNSFIRDYHDVLLWNQDGAWVKSNPGGMYKNPEFYFKRGLSYNLGGKVFKVRKLPETVLFTQGSSGIFLNAGYEQLEDYLLGVLKSKAVNYFLLQINPTNNTTPNDVKKIPIILDEHETMKRIDQLSCCIQNIYLDKMRYDPISEYYEKNAFESFWCGDVEKTCLRYLEYLEQINQRLILLKAKLDEQVFQLYRVTRLERAMIEEEFRRENSAEPDYDSRKTELTREEKKKMVLLEYLRMIAKEIMLNEERKIYDRYELEQLIRTQIISRLGESQLHDIENLLKTKLSELLIKGIQFGSRRKYLFGTGSEDLTEPYLRSKLIGKQGAQHEYVYWHHSQFLFEFDPAALEVMQREFKRIAEEVYLPKFLDTKNELYEKCILSLRM